MMTLHVKTSELLFAEANSSSNNETIGSHNAGQLRDHLRQQALQYACQAATVARDFRETYGLKIITPFITHTMALAIFIFITNLQTKPQRDSQDATDGQPENAIHEAELESAFGECFRCMLSAGMQQMYPRGVVRLIHGAATALNFTLPKSALQMLQIFNDNSWEPLYTDDTEARHVIDEMLQGGRGQYPVEGQPEMEDLLKTWEELGLQDKSNLLSGEEDLASSSGSPETRRNGQ